MTGGCLTPILIAGTLPGVIAGSFIRVKLLPGARVFDLVVAAVLIPLGVWLVLTGPSHTNSLDRPVVRIPAPVLVVLAGVVGCVGGIYGIGGGAILAPIPIGLGRKPAQVAPAALAATFVTSAGGVITFTILSLHQHICVAPDWPTGIALGVGGLAGGYTGARIQSTVPELLIRRLVGVLVIAIGAYYLSSGSSTVRPCSAATFSKMPKSGSVGETSRSMSVKNAAAPGRDVIEIISPPPGPNRNQCVAPAGKCTKLPDRARRSSSPSTPKFTCPAIT